MTRIEVVTYDLLTGCTEVDMAWDVTDIPDGVTEKMLAVAQQTADIFAGEDHSTDHVVYVRGV